MHIFSPIDFKKFKLQQKEANIFSPAARTPSLEKISFWGENINQKGGGGGEHKF